MAKRQGFAPQRDAEDMFLRLLDGTAGLLLILGGLATLGASGFLIYYYSAFAGNTSVSPEQGLAAVETFKKVLIPGVLALGIGTSYRFWGEDVLGVLQLIGGLFLYTSPMWLPSVMGAPSGDAKVSSAAAEAMRTGGTFLLGIAIFVLAIDGIGRVRQRLKYGAKADQLKYGKGIKKENVKNVLMGKCWQLPYCRQFVRERCPIFHAKRTCWKERVGCMCEEQVINNALQNKAIPKDELMAAQYIPRNTKISPQAKIERCKQCVIYNEHQRHKYKVALPTTIGALLLIYLLFKPALMVMLDGVLTSTDRLIGAATFREKTGNVGQVLDNLSFLKEVLLVAMLLVILAYILKVIEYLFFTLKV